MQTVWAYLRHGRNFLLNSALRIREESTAVWQLHPILSLEERACGDTGHSVGAAGEWAAHGINQLNLQRAALQGEQSQGIRSDVLPGSRSLLESFFLA